MQNFIESFLEMMVAERGVSPRTSEAYQRDLEDYLYFLNTKNISLLKAKREDLQEYIQQLAANGMAPKTQARRLSALREFYRFLFSENRITKNPTDYILSPKIGKPLPKYLSEKHVNRIIKVAQEENLRISFC